MAASVLVLSALEAERRTLVELLDRPERTRLLDRPVVVGELDGRTVVVADVGIGKVNAAVQTSLLVEHHRPDLILFTGVAGALDPALEVGDVVVATDVVQHDAGVHTEDGFVTYQAGHVPFFNPTDHLGHSPSRRLLDMAQASLDGLELANGPAGRPPRIVFGRVLSGDQFVDSVSVRDELRTRLGGVAVEMEGGAVAQTVTRFGIDHLIVRAVSDHAGAGSALDFTRFLDQVAANSVTVVAAILGGLDDT